MTVKALMGLAGLLAFAMPQTAKAADCDLAAISVVGGQISVDYDNFAPSDQTVPVRLISTASGDCSNSRVQLRLEPVDGQSLGPDGSLNLLNGSESLVGQLQEASRTRPLSQRADVAASALRLDGAGGFSLGDLLFILARGQQPAPGVYQAQVKLVAQVINPNGGAPVSVESVVVIQVVVRPSVALSAAWGTDLDLGVLAANGRAAAPVRFRAYANTPYDLVLTSDNGFGLRRSGAAATSIAYSPLIDGAAVPEGAARSKAFERPANVSGYRDHNLNVVVPTLAARPAGDYEDVVTVSIQPAL